MSAVLVPYSDRGTIDWPAFEAHVARTIAAGLTPAVNMDTGYVQLLTDDEREHVLDLTAKITDGAFVAGAYVPTVPERRSTAVPTWPPRPRPSPRGAARR